MTAKEFLTYLEEHLTNYDLFISKATEAQIEKNKKRPPKKRWDEKKIARSVANLWKSSMQIAYDKIKTSVGRPQEDPYQFWITFMNDNDMLEAINDSIAELEFE